MSVVLEALRHPECERESFLRNACRGDPALFDEAWRMVEAEQRMQGFLLAPLFTNAELTNPASESPFQAGRVVNGRFRLIREIGKGGMGVVYEARDQRLDDRPVAIKCARPGFQRHLPPELVNATSIAHLNVCKVFEIHTAPTPYGDVDFLTMEFLDGETLMQRIERAGPLPVADVLELAKQLCAGLEAAHSQGVIHGDFKSNNILLVGTADGAPRPVITDFGLASQVSYTSKSSHPGGAVGGVPSYMAPELLRGERPSKATDLYALGVVLFEATTGKVPFPAGVSSEQRRAALRKQLFKDFPRLPGRLRESISRCLETDPALRPASAAEILHEMRRGNPGWRLAITALIAFVAAGPSPPLAGESVRLALLPLTCTEQQRSLANGLLILSGQLLTQVGSRHRGFSTIPVEDSLRQQIKTPEAARRALGATHVLRGSLEQSGENISLRAVLVDTRSSEALKETVVEQPIADVRHLPMAVAGMVTSTLGLPPVNTGETVNRAAYPYFVSALAQLQDESSLDRAIEALDRAQDLDSHSPLIFAALSEARLNKWRRTMDPEFRDGAIEAIQKAESLNPDLAPVRSAAGRIRLEQEQYSEAATDFRRAIILNPNDPDAYWGLADALKGLRRDEEAIAAFRKAIEVQPGYFKTYVELGAFYYERGQYEKAAEEFRNVLERLTPDQAEGHRILGTAYLRLGWYAESEAELRTAVKLRETNATLADLAAVLTRKGDDLHAIYYRRKAIAASPNFFIDWLNLGGNYRRTLQIQEARSAYTRGLELARAFVVMHPQSTYARACKAYLEARLGDREHALDEIEQALNMPGRDISASRMAVLTYEVLGLRERSLAMLSRAPRSLLEEIGRHEDLQALAHDPEFSRLYSSASSQQ
jgi:serine/threonine protein kinase/tetratricopeptide (TPR) repeat protein